MKTTEHTEHTGPTWPKGVRRISKLTFSLNPELGLVYVTLWRVNRGTGYEDLSEIGALTLADFQRLVAAAGETLAESEGRGKTLVEKFAGTMERENHQDTKTPR